MPTALVKSLMNELLILIRRRGLFSTVPLFITKQASRNDVMLFRRSAILMSLKVFAGTLKTSGLAKSNLVSLSEFIGIVRPHGVAAIIAAAVLAVKSDRAGFYE